MPSLVPTVDRRLGLSLARACVGAVAGFVVLATSVGSVAQAQEPEPIMRVEEDWQLVLNEPDGDLMAPQLHTLMSPLGHLDSFYVQVTWNYRELPEFEPGGFQVQGWEGQTFKHLKNSDGTPFSEAAETITWTQVLATNGNEVGFVILNGQSTTWGAFGGSETIVGGSVGVDNLNNYSPQTSVQNSCVTYGTNRVALLAITQVRYYGTSGLLWVDTTPRVLVVTREE